MFMKWNLVRLGLVWLLALLILSACRPGTPSPETASLSPTAPDLTATLPNPQVEVTRVPDAEAAARAYLDAWKVDDYAAMYRMLTPISQDAIDGEAFTDRYRQAMAVAGVQSLDYTILSALVKSKTAEVAYRVTWHTALLDEIVREVTMHLTLEDGAWRVQWDEALVLPDLVGGKTLYMDYKVPARGNIYDRNGQPLVAETDALSIGLIPGQVDPEQEEDLLTEIWRLTGIRPDTIRSQMEKYQPDWYLPIGETTADAVQARGNRLYNYSGVVIRPFHARYYYGAGVAAHAVGYVSAIQAEEAEEYQRQGYRIDQYVGRMGLERWGEPYLAGRNGGALYLISPDGQVLEKLAETGAQPAADIVSTLDYDLQAQAEAAMQEFAGAIVVLERDTGRVLALVSRPGFDPNAFQPLNYNSSYLLNLLFGSGNLPLLDRATQGQYPPGSTFKIITMAAALESGLYTPQTTYDCGYFFRELQGLTLNDWTYDHYLQDGETPPSGHLTLQEGLMRSCNPFFWHIGLDLYNQGLVSAVTDMAHAFGLGQATGIEIGEAEGQVPEPTNAVDAVNQAIGQGALLVTPLQMADWIAAIGNGGTLYRPSLVERVVDIDGNPILEFQPEVRGTLPVSPENLAAIREAMRWVVTNRRGTAYYRFLGMQIPVYGKTGTASVDGFREPHAWFVGFTDAGREDKPDIAVVVVLENAGEGADYAAPVFRRVVEAYFYGRPRVRYPWESEIGVTKTPTPEVTETPVP